MAIIIKSMVGGPVHEIKVPVQELYAENVYIRRGAYMRDTTVSPFKYMPSPYITGLGQLYAPSPKLLGKSSAQRQYDNSTIK